jgi:hypothetical protein
VSVKGGNCAFDSTSLTPITQQFISNEMVAREKISGESEELVLWLSQVGKRNAALVGGKGANLGELVSAGFPVPNGFCVTSAAYALHKSEEVASTMPTKVKESIIAAYQELSRDGTFSNTLAPDEGLTLL